MHDFDIGLQFRLSTLLLYTYDKISYLCYYERELFIIVVVYNGKEVGREQEDKTKTCKQVIALQEH